MSLQAVQVRRFVAARGAPAGRGSAHVLAIGSGRGGAGTSLIAALLAARAQGLGRRVLLIDADPLFGVQHLLWGVGAGPGIAALRGSGLEADDLLVPLGSQLSLATLAPLGGSDLAADVRTLLRRVAGLFSDWDTVVIDAGSRRSSLQSCRDLGAGLLLVVGQSDSIGIATTHAFLKAAGIDAPGLDTAVIFNRVGAHEAEYAAEALRDGVERFLDRPLRVAGVFPADARLASALAAGVLLPGALAESPLWGLADRVLNPLLVTVADR